MTRFQIPRALPALMGIIGVVVGGSSVAGIIRRLEAMTTRPCPGCLVAPPALRSPMGLVLTGLAALMAVGALLLAARWLAARVEVDATGVGYRTLFGRGRVDIADLKGVVLRQREGLPQLRIVRLDGETVVVPAWSLRALHPDGEVETAGPALQRLGAEHGFKVKVISLTTPMS